MTTDSVSKEAVFTGTDAEGNEFTIGGMAKGAGMLAPGPGHHAGGPHHRRRRPA